MPASGSRLIASTEIPASFGVHGPGETTARSHSPSSSSSTSAASLRTARPSAPPPPRASARPRRGAAAVPLALEQLVDLRRVVADGAHVRPQLAQVLHEVVGERVVVVD